MKILKLLLKELGAYVYFFVRNIPGFSGNALRGLIYGIFFKKIGKKVYIPTTVFFKGFENICIGNGVIFGNNNMICAESFAEEVSIQIGTGVTFNSNVMVNADIKGEIIIEDDAMIGPNVVMRASGHEYKDPNRSIRQQGHVRGKIVIGNGAWIGANAVILPNVAIGRGAVVGAGAVVTKDVGEFDIVCGVPAKKIRSRREV